jgi:hypothetical protein
MVAVGWNMVRAEELERVFALSGSLKAPQIEVASFI